MLDKKLAAILVAVMMVVSITTLAVPALSEDDEDKAKDKDREDDNDKKDRRDDRGREDDKARDDKDKSSKEVTVAEKKGRVEYEIEIEDNMMKLKVEVRNFDDGDYRVVLECMDMPSDAENPVLEGVLMVNNGRGEVKIRDNIVDGDYKDCTLYIGDRTFTINDFRAVAGEQERKRGDEGLEIKAEVIDGITIVKIEDEFVAEIDNSEINTSVANLILTRLNLTTDDISSILKVERVDESDDVGKDRMRSMVHVRDGLTKIKFMYRFITNETDTDRLASIISDKIASITRDDVIASINAKMLKKDDVKVTVDKVKSGIVDDSLLRNIDRLDRVIGNDRAVISMRLTLEAENNTRSFGSADMLFIKSNNRDIGRVAITIITAEPVEDLVACYNGDNIGRLDMRDAEGFRVGTLKTFIDNITVNIPGVEISIVDSKDNNCEGNTLLFGSL